MTVISPELALIDADLAALARASLHEPGQFVPSFSAERIWPGVSYRPQPATRAPDLAAVPSSRQRPVPTVSRVGAAAVLAVVATSALVVLLGARVNADPAQRASDPAFVTTRQSIAAADDVSRASNYVWPAVPGAVAYRVEIDRNGTEVFAATTEKPSIVLPATHSLAPGRYTWSVTEALASGEVSPHAQPIAEATFLVSGSATG